MLSRICWEKDSTLKDRTVLSVKDINLLLEFCLKNTHFSFQNQFYEQVEGTAMGSTSVPLYLTYIWSTFSKKLSVLPPLPRLWWRYVDDTFVIQKEIHKQDSLQHINSVDFAIQFTVENNRENGAIIFLDTL